jgi:hypothetical protein
VDPGSESGVTEKGIKRKAKGEKLKAEDYISALLLI